MGIILTILITDLLQYPALLKIYHRKRELSLFLLITGLIVSVSTWAMIIMLFNKELNADNPWRMYIVLWLVWLLFFSWIPRLTGYFIFWMFLLGGRLNGKARLVWKPLVVIILSGIIIGVAGNISASRNFKVLETEILMKDLNPALEGVRIVQISDLHLSSFHNNRRGLEEAVNRINNLHPDIIVNTGDFVTVGAGEFGTLWEVLQNERPAYVKIAVRGNHDSGTYLNSTDSALLKRNLFMVDSLIMKSGYVLLNDSAMKINIKGADLWIAGVTCSGRHPYVTHGDIGKAIATVPDSSSLILLSHDPNSWDDVTERFGRIDLTLSGHTHAIQAGIKAGRFQWSPSKYLYPRWFGRYEDGDQTLYVNRGLGTIGAPVRFGMSPEITVLTLKRK